MTFRPLDDRTLVAGQLRPHDMAEAAAHGITLIINNRPDAEEPGQPTSAEIESAARNAGLDYRHIPVAGGISAADVDAMAGALSSARGKALVFCRSGTRSTFLWALAEASRGRDLAELIECAAPAGYDLRALLQ